MVVPYIHEQLKMGDSADSSVVWDVHILKKDEQYQFRRDVL